MHRTLTNSKRLSGRKANRPNTRRVSGAIAERKERAMARAQRWSNDPATELPTPAKKPTKAVRTKVAKATPPKVAKATPPKVQKPRVARAPKTPGFMLSANGKPETAKLKLLTGGKAAGLKHSIYVQSGDEPTAAELKMLRTFVAQQDARRLPASPFRDGFNACIMLKKLNPVTRTAKDGHTWSFMTRGMMAFGMGRFPDLRQMLTTLKDWPV